MSSVPETAHTQDIVEVGAEDLPVYCPGPKAPLWCQHPRIYIEVVKSQVARCQYCGTRYALREDAKVHGH
ncbi:MAG: zinc-finger domain-containing protein [Castellaniella sp.]|uniref:zinc-finger domain-containing protein n=1 Tax=Castellaniella sp. TaxID=1955812 RepID=UPI002A36ACEE|nr:zinc-finger domain-containing protein [Castellaniella sp.]MDY0309520.1 zinc-finger domain-containing protein [Castellaniella sp.]